MNGRSDGLHDEVGEKERKTDKRLIRRSGLRSQSLPQKMEDDEYSHERRHRKENRRKKGKQREQKNDGDRSGVSANGKSGNLKDRSVLGSDGWPRHKKQADSSHQGQRANMNTRELYGLHYRIPS